MGVLEAAGLSVFIDTRELDGFDEITETLERGLLCSRVVLALYSEVYAERPACQHELTLGVVASLGAGPSRILVANPLKGVEHVQPASLRDQRMIFIDAEGLGLEELASAVSNQLVGISGTIGDSKLWERADWYPARPPRWSRFVGRGAALWKIHDALEADRRAMTLESSGPARVVVSGLAGVGKSLLVEEYARRLDRAYPGGIFWINADGSGEVDAVRGRRERAFGGVAIHLFGDKNVDLGDPVGVRGQLERHFHRKGLRCLWIVDSLPPGLDDAEFAMWLGPSVFCQSVVTTQCTTYRGSAISLGCLSMDASRQLLGCHLELGTLNRESVGALLKALGGHPLAIEVAGAFAAIGTVSVDILVERLHAADGRVLEVAGRLAGSLPQGHSKSIVATFMVAIAHLGLEGWRFLFSASWLAAAPISARLAAGIFEQFLGEEGPDLCALGVSECVGVSLARDVELGAGLRGYVVHELVGQVVRLSRNVPGEKDSFLGGAWRAWTRVVGDVSDIRRHAQVQWEMPHAYHLVRVIPVSPARGEIRMVLSHYSITAGALAAAAEQARMLLDEGMELGGADHPLALEGEHILGVVLNEQGDPRGACGILEPLLPRQELCWGARSKSALTTANVLGSAMMGCGRAADALPLLKRVYEQRKSALGDEHGSTLFAANNLGSAYLYLGDLVRAIEVLGGARAIRRRIFGDDDPDTVVNTLNIARCLELQGDRSRAREELRGALDVACRARGDESPLAVRALTALARFLIAEGGFEEARGLAGRAAVAADQVFDGLHQDSIEARFWQSVAMRNLGELSAAGVLMEAVRMDAKELLPASHPLMALIESET
ncbi:hypothetical protein Pla163_04150 [Planctomycetes bacterium Pla163]|uniref:TIR domain-containing protein n=2 Tax=Rohdeia mirabilis TaxID=2528008 RepID=A0A518CVQ9_9BACT|nr:hypothetical protein Pla163_04150 [Planctomycetes bacterium Pla163]